jgi:hypothetical protein
MSPAGTDKGTEGEGYEAGIKMKKEEDWQKASRKESNNKHPRGTS